MTKVRERPIVSVAPQTATTVEIIIETENGNVRLIAGHDDVYVQASPVKVRVQS